MDPRLQNQQRPNTRPRTKSGFSFRRSLSNKSSETSSHKRKESHEESPSDKRKTHMSQTTKANPNAAISEAQPIAQALEKTTITSLANIRCNDIHGNPISDPDKSNPTRWRMERPLDTIKSFEMSIERAHASRQSSYYPNGPNGPQSRRTSYMGASQGHAGYDQSQRQSNGPGAGYGASRDSYGESGQNGYNGYNGYNGSNKEYGQGPMRGQQGYGPQGAPIYPAVGNSRSKDTLNTGGSGGSDQWNNSTNPTSDEGSLERANGVSRPVPVQSHSGYQQNYGSYDEQAYGNNGGPPRPPQHMAGNNGYNGGNYNQNQGIGENPPPPPPKQAATKNIIRLSQTAVQSEAAPAERSSWFKKRFSKGK
ncbi:hypothetical protein BT63DRAFT_16720 [Microthyrium microscopicum]|uniref:DUF2406 domain-containing protein n=1 Tax=Microthyrium microscopicum TaxID=703497 RepID=A0A6A6UQX1_9PEZI|nr:hypothetical protein BT63DRAFT_16720 [Microthyrium microscopicum]